MEGRKVPIGRRKVPIERSEDSDVDGTDPHLRMDIWMDLMMETNGVCFHSVCFSLCLNRVAVRLGDIGSVTTPIRTAVAEPGYTRIDLAVEVVV